MRARSGRFLSVCCLKVYDESLPRVTSWLSNTQHPSAHARWLRRATPPPTPHSPFDQQPQPRALALQMAGDKGVDTLHDSNTLDAPQASSQSRSSRAPGSSGRDKGGGGSRCPLGGMCLRLHREKRAAERVCAEPPFPR